MLGAVFIGGVCFYLYRLLGGAPLLVRRQKTPNEAVNSKIDELTEYASRLRAQNRFTSAEKVYLEILKIDHKHVPTYSRLGTLYSAQKSYGDAIECFQIASQLQPAAGTFYNLGLAYFENRNYIKAIASFDKAIMFEPSVQRYVGLAKAYRKTHEDDKMIQALQQATDLDPSPKVLWLLADSYTSIGMNSEANEVIGRIRSINPRDERIRKLKQLKNPSRMG